MWPGVASGSVSAAGHLASAVRRSLRVGLDGGRPWGTAVIVERPMVSITFEGARFPPGRPAPRQRSPTREPEMSSISASALDGRFRHPVRRRAAGHPPAP